MCINCQVFFYAKPDSVHRTRKQLAGVTKLVLMIPIGLDLSAYARHSASVSDTLWVCRHMQGDFIPPPEFPGRKRSIGDNLIYPGERIR